MSRTNEPEGISNSELFANDAVTQVISHLDSYVDPFDYLDTVYRRYNTIVDANGYTIMDTLDLAASTFEEDRPAIGFDPGMPNKTGFIMGCHLALDVLTELAARNDIEVASVLNRWTDSPSFILDDNDTPVLGASARVANLLRVMSEQRFAMLRPSYRGLLSRFQERMVDEGYLAVDQIPYVSYGFSFAVVGCEATLELERLEKRPPRDVTDDEISRWLTG